LSAEVDVVVVGAGFAGLTAASTLAEAGVSAVVLEAAARVGGRTDSTMFGSVPLELGGQWTGPGQERVSALADRFGVEMFQTPTDGAFLHAANGVVGVSEVEPPYTPVVLALDAIAASIPPSDPWTTPAGADLDSMPLSTWLEANVTDRVARASALRVLEGLMCVPGDQMSLLSILHGATTSGTLAAALGVEGGAQELRLVGGFHGLALRLADQLGDAVRLSTPVGCIRETGGGVEAHYDGGSVRASRCVVAVPPSNWADIEFGPALPPTHALLTELMPLGSVIKVQAVYERPFWRDLGYSGLVVDEDGPFEFMADNTAPDSDAGVLVSFLSARDAIAWGDAALGVEAVTRRGSAFAEQVRRVFGPTTPEPLGFVDRDWCAVPWVGGGYSGVMKPGGWMRAGAALREPVGPLHFASSESAHEWNGYVEGALDAGTRAAREVLNAL
jgi:monoamine oxidase